MLLCCEWEYCCEESLPMPVKILSKQYGFNCMVLSSINSEDSKIDLSVKNKISGMSVLDSVDMMVFLPWILNYLIKLKRLKHNGQVGFITTGNEDAFKNIKVWQSK